MDIKQLLIDGCSEMGVNISDEQVDKFIKYKELLIEWNEKVNLTAITEDKEVIIKHFLDCISVFKFEDFKNKKIIDVGTGAGFPGLPIKIMEESCEVTLLDSLNKRVNFLSEVKNELGLQKLNLVHGRAEDYGVNKNYREKFDFAVSRAVANLSTLAEYCMPYVALGGVFVSLKGPEVDEEIKSATGALKALGGEIQKNEKITLPFTDISHSIIFIKKIKQTPSNYPRKAGKPSKDPIK